MKRRWSFLMTACLGTLIFVLAATAGETVRITNGEWPPYLSPQLKHYGLASRIITEAFALEGVSVEYGFFPWREGLELARSGSWDAASFWSRTPDRERDFYLSDPIMVCEIVFLHLNSFPFDWKTSTDLRSVHIGGTEGYNYGPLIRECEATGIVSIDRSPSDEEGLRRLLAGKLDVFLIDRIVGFYMLFKHFSPEDAERVDFAPLSLTLPGEGEMFLLLSRQNPDNARRVELFNRGLARLKATGRIEQVYMEEAFRGGYEQ